MKHHEDLEQEVLFEWASYNPVLKWMHAIPNGGNRDAREGARLKRQGVKSGVYDVFLPLPAKGFHGLYIELKRRKVDGSHRIYPSQKLFGKDMALNGYKCAVCFGASQAIDIIKEYIKGVKVQP